MFKVKLLLNINIYMKTMKFYRAISCVSKGFNIFIPIFIFTVRATFLLSEILKSDSFTVRLTALSDSYESQIMMLRVLQATGKRKMTPVKIQYEVLQKYVYI